ncbi:BLUF domain-containing protein [Loktanella sp. SALINAS62]|uniref:BLUF domain-containing protein n=1 Tax=Loktanella sp. SALINAS62 TaxID=2706124 RepID=UPI001B8A93EB|nr:BLUF domain-containing protein [Loktanella sp. SALINAS62]MBS1300930.1 BLUF domain-containing protein [Loktanella sp. SALINAS62]
MAPKGETIITDLTQLIYASQPFGYDAILLSDILNDARACNLRDDITGALVCRHDIYLQLLEGPTEQVTAAYTRICRDDRHVAVHKLVSRQVTSRMFGNWAMLHDPAKSLIWTKDQIDDGILDRIPPSEIIGMFESVSRNAGPEHAT